jgi:hypothetical protein
MKPIVAEFISDDLELPSAKSERLFHNGWENVVFRLDDLPGSRVAAPARESEFPFEGDDPFAPLPGTEIK